MILSPRLRAMYWGHIIVAIVVGLVVLVAVLVRRGRVREWHWGRGGAVFEAITVDELDAMLFQDNEE